MMILIGKMEVPTIAATAWLGDEPGRHYRIIRAAQTEMAGVHSTFRRSIVASRRRIA
ncbi:MAG: hypothetical protein ACRCUI_01365 [Polymorphobacter sp.]